MSSKVLWPKALRRPFCKAFFCCMVLTSCRNQETWIYPDPPPSQSAPILKQSLAVPPFSDQRVNANSNYFDLSKIPLLPFGWQDFNCPEGMEKHVNSTIWLWIPCEDLAKAAAAEVEASHLFEEVFFTRRHSEGQLVLQGNLKSAYYHSKQLSYCFGFLAIYPWLLGCPRNYAYNELELVFKLKDNSQRGKVLWEKTYKNLRSNVGWIYYQPSDFKYSEIAEELFSQLVADLRAFLLKYETQGSA